LTPIEALFIGHDEISLDYVKYRRQKMPNWPLNGLVNEIVRSREMITSAAAMFEAAAGNTAIFFVRNV